MSDSDHHPGARGKVSVCMAAYNGQEFIVEQITSILAQLQPDDELIIVDDCSSDETASLVNDFSDERLRLIESSVNRGYVRSFELAVLESSGDYVLLADQDDIWIPARVDSMVRALRKKAVVAGNFEYLSEVMAKPKLQLRSVDSSRKLSNIFAILIGYRPYYGCAMAVRRDFVSSFVPIPSYLNESHDLWLALVANVSGEMLHLDEPVLYRRLHDNNATPRHWRPLPTILKARWTLLRCLFEAVRRRRASKL